MKTFPQHLKRNLKPSVKKKKKKEEEKIRKGVARTLYLYKLMDVARRNLADGHTRKDL